LPALGRTPHRWTRRLLRTRNTSREVLQLAVLKPH